MKLPLRSLSKLTDIFCQLMSMNKVTSEDVSMFLSAVLVGLQKHGQHESIQPLLLSLALRIYELAVSSVAVFQLLLVNFAEISVSSFCLVHHKKLCYLLMSTVCVFILHTASSV